MTKANTISKRNAETSRQEVEEFRTTDFKEYTAYVDSEGVAVTTWTGERLGTIVATRGAAVVVRAINGRRYYGRPNGRGMWICLRQYSQQEPNVLFDVKLTPEVS